MYCPNCGAKNSNEQKFCRFCGLNIETTIQSLQTQLSKKEKGDNFQVLKWLKRSISFGSMFFASLVFVFVIGNYVFDWQLDRSFSRISLACFGVLRITDWIVGSFFRPKGYAETIGNEDVALNRIGQLETNKLLEDKPFETISSVTENSTELLLVENKTRRFD